MPSGAVKEAAADAAFGEVVQLIQAARQRAVQAVNTDLITLYWHIGELLHHRIEADGWAKGTVVQLAAYITRREPGLRGFSSQNLWRMRQFFQAYRGQAELSTLLRALPWSSHLHILSRTKRVEEREFYLRMATQHRWPVREVARQIEGGLFEQAVLNPPKLSTALRVLQSHTQQNFKDAYLLEFLALPEHHSEADLHRSLLQNLGRFLTELGRDFCYIGSASVRWIRTLTLAPKVAFGRMLLLPSPESAGLPATTSNSSGVPACASSRRPFGNGNSCGWPASAPWLPGSASGRAVCRINS